METTALCWSSRPRKTWLKQCGQTDKAKSRPSLGQAWLQTLNSQQITKFTFIWHAMEGNIQNKADSVRHHSGSYLAITFVSTWFSDSTDLSVAIGTQSPNKQDINQGLIYMRTPFTPIISSIQSICATAFYYEGGIFIWNQLHLMREAYQADNLPKL